MKLSHNATILFQGDSITDAGRTGDQGEMGAGYAAMVHGMIAAKYPDRTYKFINRGNGGDRTVELLARWKKDCLDLKPDLLSLKIGVNDVWRLRGEWNGQKFVPFDEYEKNYRDLLQQAQQAGIKHFALLSPSTIFNDQDEEISAHLRERAALVKKLAKEVGGIYVPILETQTHVLKHYPNMKWTGDGCHPTQAGHAILAQTWMDAVSL